MATMKKSSIKLLLFLSIVAAAMVVVMMNAGTVAAAGRSAALSGPRNFTFYMHNEVYSTALNNSVFTSAYSAGPLDFGQPNPYNFGVRSTFEMPITSGPTTNSTQIGVAQGIWVLDSLQGFSLLHMFTANITSGPFTGTIAIFGQIVESRDTRILAVVGGTGNFLAARGVAYNKLVTIDPTPPSTWTLSFNLNLYY